MGSEDVLSYYNWESGECFRHPDFGKVDTTVVKTLQPRGNSPREIRACRLCVVDMENQRRRAAERSGREYKPGLPRD